MNLYICLDGINRFLGIFDNLVAARQSFVQTFTGALIEFGDHGIVKAHSLKDKSVVLCGVILEINPNATAHDMLLCRTETQRES